MARSDAAGCTRPRSRISTISNAYEVYAAGPPAMIAAVQREFDSRGVASRRLYFDSFDYAPDTLERQRSSAATKS